MTDFEFYQKQREEDRSKKFLHYISNYSFHFFYLKAREELPLSDFEKEIIDEGLRNLNKELLERMRRFTSHEIEMGDVIMDTGPLCSKYRREILYQLEKIEKASADRLRDILELYRIEEKKEKKERRKMLLESMK